MPAGADSCVRTRAGRLVKSVNRLIEFMIQRPVLRSPNIRFGGSSHSIFVGAKE